MNKRKCRLVDYALCFLAANIDEKVMEDLGLQGTEEEYLCDELTELASEMQYRILTPDRVVTKVVDGSVAEAKHPRRTPIEPDVLFVRNDGWILGCRYTDEAAAEACWSGQWVKRIDLRQENETPAVEGRFEDTIF